MTELAGQNEMTRCREKRRWSESAVEKQRGRNVLDFDEDTKCFRR